MESFGAYVGLDWSEEKHDVCTAIGEKREYGVIQHNGDEIRKYFSSLSRKIGEDKKIAVCLEQGRGALFNVLSEIPALTLFAINPATLSRYRNAFAPSGAKDDVSDADIACDLVKNHRERIRATAVTDEITKELDILNRYRRDAVDQRSSLGLKLGAVLKCYFPQVCEIFADLTAPIALEFLKRFPSHACLTGVKGEELLEFFTSHHSVKAALNEKRIAILRSGSFIENNAVITPCMLHAKRLVREILALDISIKEFTKEITKVSATHPDIAIFKSFPATGILSASRLTVLFGIDRTRFANAETVMNCYGISPVRIQSGKSELITARKAKSHFAHQSLVGWAGQTVIHSKWAKEFYRKKKAKGVSHRVAIRALAFKWGRILFSCWKNSTPYSEERYLKTQLS